MVQSMENIVQRGWCYCVCVCACVCYRVAVVKDLQLEREGIESGGDFTVSWIIRLTNTWDATHSIVFLRLTMISEI